MGARGKRGCEAAASVRSTAREDLLQSGMTRSIDPETIDLARLAAVLRGASGETVIGAVVGRTRLRDEVVRHLRCSQLEGETLVDTMIGRGFIRREVAGDGQVEWIIDSQV